MIVRISFKYMPNKITNDELGQMIKSGFDQVDKRFERVDKRFEGLENRLDTLDQGQEDIKLKITNLAYRF